MNYVKHFNIFGVAAKQIPCITGLGAPTSKTAAAVGCFYMDVSRDTKDIYKCTAASDGTYAWDKLGDDSVLYTEQVLTEAQKQQVRENIGVDLSNYCTKDNVQSMIDASIAKIAVYGGEVEEV